MDKTERSQLIAWLQRRRDKYAEYAAGAQAAGGIHAENAANQWLAKSDTMIEVLKWLLRPDERPSES